MKHLQEPPIPKPSQPTSLRRFIRDLNELKVFVLEAPYERFQSQYEEYLLGMPLPLIYQLSTQIDDFRDVVEALVNSSRSTKIYIRIEHGLAQFKDVSLSIRGFFGFLKEPKRHRVRVATTNSVNQMNSTLALEAIEYVRKFIKVSVIWYRFDTEKSPIVCRYPATGRHNLRFYVQPFIFAKDIERRKERLITSTITFSNTYFMRLSVNNTNTDRRILRRLFSLWKGKEKQLHLRMNSFSTQLDPSSHSFLLDSDICLFLDLPSGCVHYIHFIGFIRRRGITCLRGSPFNGVNRTDLYHLGKAAFSTELQMNNFYQTTSLLNVDEFFQISGYVKSLMERHKKIFTKQPKLFFHAKKRGRPFLN